MIHYVFQKVDGTGAIGINPVIPGFLLIREFEVIKGFKKIPGLRRYKRIWRGIEGLRGFEGRKNPGLGPNPGRSLILCAEKSNLWNSGCFSKGRTGQEPSGLIQ